jgi:hypothetical protein
MVKVFLIFLLLSFSVFADDEPQDILTQKIKSFIDLNLYEKNRDFIEIIFSPKSNFYINDRVDAVKVASTLKENGLLKLFFPTPRELNLHFKTSGSPLFFVKLMSDSLRNIGYYRYVTRASNLTDTEFTWSISLNSEYATDPEVLQKELNNAGCEIIDIQRNSSTDWVYVIDMARGYLDIETLEEDIVVKLKRSLYAHWLNVSQIQELRIKSSPRNNWYPYIAYYDASLHLLKVIKQDSKEYDMTFEVPKFAKYIKISDIYTLKNIKDELSLYPIGSR